jgi:hypothetical protein
MQKPILSAPGNPGIPARWTSSAKTRVGTSISNESHVRFIAEQTALGRQVKFTFSGRKQSVGKAKAASLASILYKKGKYDRKSH